VTRSAFRSPGLKFGNAWAWPGRPNNIYIRTHICSIHIRRIGWASLYFSSLLNKGPPLEGDPEKRSRGPPPPRIWAHIQGRYWSAKIDDIVTTSLCNTLRWIVMNWLLGHWCWYFAPWIFISSSFRIAGIFATCPPNDAPLPRWWHSAPAATSCASCPEGPRS
jgi:hypothetical protein